MKRAELEHACEPQPPEMTLEGLKQLYNDLSESSWSKEGDLFTLNAAIEVMKLAIEDCQRKADIERIDEQLRR